MQKLQDFLDKLPDTIKPIAAGLAIVCLVIAGVMFMLGRKKREEGKEVAMGAIEGVFIVSFIVAGVMFMLGRKKREEGKEVAMGAVEGIMLVSGATSLVSWLVAFLA